MKVNKKSLLVIIFVTLSVIHCGCLANKTKNDIKEYSHYDLPAKSETPQAPTETAVPQTDKTEIVSENTSETYNDSSDIKTDSPVLETEEAEEKTESTTNPQGLMCTVVVKCDAVLANLDKLDKSKYNLVPDNGIIFSSKTVEFCEGESAFDVLLREMNKNNIHMEFEYTPAFKSHYVEGIGNLYEFDCGDMSGWIYKINGKIANVSCSQYMLKQGDVIEWVYTCGF